MRAEVAERARKLRASRELMLRYLDEKLSGGDLHGVMDASADIREIDAELRALEWVLSLPRA